ncbi:MAG: hypothetical protein IKQ37_06310 [Bacteroidaceae bacterium]|nr:hypothetical protein [Bacteroidaceae bacterium]
MVSNNCFKELFLLLISFSLLLFSSCQSGVDGTAVPEEGQGTVTFSVTNYRQISFDDLSSSAATRSDIPTDHPSTLAHLLIAVFDFETGQQVCSPIQHDQKDYTKQHDTYPKFTVTLPYGHYRVLVLGYNGSRTCKIASANHISWDDNYVPNTFIYCEEFTLDKNTDLDQKITLQHVVAAFCLETEDATPTELKKMRFCSTAGGTVLDATTGFTPQSTGRTSEIVIPDNHLLGIKDTFTVYLFLPEEQISADYTVQALGKNDAVLFEKRFKDVPLRINTLTLWQGNFFVEEAEEVNAGLSLYWDTQWADTVTISH